MRSLVLSGPNVSALKVKSWLREGPLYPILKTMSVFCAMSNKSGVVFPPGLYRGRIDREALSAFWYYLFFWKARVTRVVNVCLSRFLRWWSLLIFLWQRYLVKPTSHMLTEWPISFCFKISLYLILKKRFQSFAYSIRKIKHFSYLTLESSSFTFKCLGSWLVSRSYAFWARTQRGSQAGLTVMIS